MFLASVAVSMILLNPVVQLLNLIVAMGEFKIKHVKPLFTTIITTATKYSSDTINELGLVVDTKRLKGELNPIQQVYEVGSTVTGIKKGDLVYINFKRYMVSQHTPGRIEDNIQHDSLSVRYEIPYVEIGGVRYLKLQNTDIEYIIDEYEPSDGGLFE